MTRLISPRPARRRLSNPASPNALAGLVAWFDLTESSNGSAAVTRANSVMSDWSLSDDGSTHCPSTTGPDGLNCANLVANASLVYTGGLETEIGRAPLTLVMLCKPATDTTGHYFARYGQASTHQPNAGSFMTSYRLLCGSTVADLQLRYVNATPGTDTVLTLNNVVPSASSWYLIAARFDPDANTVELVVVNSAGTVTKSSAGTYPPYYYRYSFPLYVGARSQSTSPIKAPIAFFAFFRTALTDAQLVWLNNGGLGRKYSGITLAVDPSPTTVAPFSRITYNGVIAATNSGSTSGHKGLYGLRPYPLFQWDPTLAASLGNYVWAHSTDHTQQTPDPGQGVWIGYSASPATLPSSWTLVWNSSGTMTDGRSYAQMEIPFMAYRSDDPNGRPFYLYAKPLMIGSPIASTEADTALRSSANLSSWTDEGYAVRAPSSVNNFTGYAYVYGPGALPGQTDWVAYHLLNDRPGVCGLSHSSDPRSFTVDETAEPLDQTTACPYPTHPFFYSYQNLFVRSGRVFMLIRNYYLTTPHAGKVQTGLAIQELSQDANSRWTVPIRGAYWPIEIPTDDFPQLGYVQEVMLYDDGSTLHVYSLHGFYPTDFSSPGIGYEEVRYFTIT